jgi:hypothetical protein
MLWQIKSNYEVDAAGCSECVFLLKNASEIYRKIIKALGYILKIVGTRLMGAIYGKNANANYQVIEVVLTV